LSNPKPRISVILHAAKSGQRVLRCLESLFNQTVPRDWYEIIVIDDSSTDDTADILRTFGDSVKVIRSAERWGSSKSRNAGVDYANGELLFFTGVDCIAESHLLEEHLHSHSKHRNCAVVGRICWQDDPRKDSFVEFLKQTGYLFTSPPPDPKNVSYEYVYTANLSLPKQRFLEVGKSDERLFPGYFSDTELGFRLKQAGCEIVFNPGAIVSHPADMGLSDFSRRMIIVGRSAVTLQSINPRVVDFSRWENRGRSLFFLKFMTLMLYATAMLLRILDKSHQNDSIRNWLYYAYEKELEYSFEYGYTIGRSLLFTNNGLGITRTH
jgi:GT2 family glycosyltransferase